MAGALPTASPPVMTPGTAAAHANYEVWARGVDDATYQNMLFIPRISEDQRPYSKSHIRKYARLTGNALSGTAVGTGLLYENPMGTEITYTPGTNYVATARQFGEDWMSNVPFDSDLGSEMESALAELSEQSACANIATLTQFRGGPTVDITAAEWRNAKAQLERNTNGKVRPGESTIYGILDFAQEPHIMSIPEFTNAEIRGDAENPQVKGIWNKAGGVMLMLTSVLTTDVNGTHGCIWIPMAFVIGWNARSQVVKQDEELQKRIIVANNFGSGVRHDLRAIGLRTSNTIPA